ncbi:adenosylhomocysteinase [Haliangium ochraceum]|uniref:Adenosylhomocysteinase n=1 Tax=Haliangium ochraceum (strain DSM 14365 / JCM 11303 / SMP-2) TaxID=502025 RepID=D0LME3_HALO1|nr:adenosylhomocysteinase [Haliangium ochraceum]ACY16849.1 adenosylhomocysteinase [Haliangium ochraceum DSM 14365]
MKETYKIADMDLAEAGRRRIEWAESRMPVLMALRQEYAHSKPLAGQRIAGSIHLTKETAVLVRTLQAAGAEVSWSGCNPLSTQDDVAAALAAEGTSVYAWYGMSRDEFYWALEQTLVFRPTLTLDDGADLIVTLHAKHPELVAEIRGGTEETTTGVQRLRAMAADGNLGFPVIAVNDSATKREFDNVYGTGQSSLDGILRASSVMIAGKQFVVAGYGQCGRGVAERARGMGASVIVTEVSATAALRAAMDGFRVMPMDEAATLGDIFITATGMKDVIGGSHFARMKDGALVCNTGHYDCELDLIALERLAQAKREVRPDNEEYTLKDGRCIYVLGKGRLINLAAAEGHPSEVMDMSFANQFIALMLLAREGRSLSNAVHGLSPEHDRDIATRKLATMGIRIDMLSDAQLHYRTDYAAGT